ncbi:hypothetical protein M2428_002398 [Arthrobacter sp. ES3-54]|nr:hypothetical protein [Arthrobacter sp. ES3-54]
MLCAGPAGTSLRFPQRLIVAGQTPKPHIGALYEEFCLTPKTNGQ